jgi:diaminohydroxyphosphoribosylaminopyrimidine deaminase/5-amino-6-(5-phosphoribosylamino)uracil reductase
LQLPHFALPFPPKDSHFAQVTTDEHFMRLALAQARKGLGRTSPNPAVGAILVAEEKVIARGYHHQAGKPHAEIEALKKSAAPEGATLYVTLEPCSTHGRTGPCTEAVIAAGIKRVVIGAVDPNPAHAGRGVDLLRNAGIEVATGVLEKECAELNRAFNKWVVTKLPYVVAKAGLTLDGRLTLPPGEGQWITNPASRADAHRIRAGVDAILIGAETLRVDNPKLTVRGVGAAKQPLRVVLTRSGNLPADAHLFTDEFKDRTLVFQNQSLSEVLRELGAREITSVLIEGGGEILGQAFDQRLVDEVVFYFAPIIAGGPTVIGGLGARESAASIRLENPLYKRIGGDIRVSGRVQK